MAQVSGAYIFGYNQGIVSGISTPLINNTYFPYSTQSTQSWLRGVLTCVLLVGGMCGSFIGVPLASRVGIRATLFITGIINIVFCVLLATLHSFVSILVCRGILGISCGMSGSVCPLYNVLVVPPAKRGRYGCVFQISVVTSIMVAFIVNYVFNINNTQSLHVWNWHTQFGLGAIGGLFLCITAILAPPVTEQHKQTRASAPTTTTQATNTSTDETADHIDITIDDQQQTEDKLNDDTPSPNNTNPATLIDLFITAPGRTCLTLSLILATAQQLTGVNVFIFYGVTIFQQVNKYTNPLLLVFTMIGIWNCVSSVGSYFVVDRYGRRPVMLSALSLMSLASLFMAIGGYTTIYALSYIGVYLFLLGYEIGPGCLFFLLAAELFHIIDAQYSDISLQFANGVAWLFNILITLFFPVVLNAIGPGNTFILLFCIGLVSLLCTYWKLPETKHIELIIRNDTRNHESTTTESASSTASPTSYQSINHT